MTIPPATKAPSQQATRDISRHVSRDISPTCWYYLNDRSVDLVVEGKTVRLQARTSQDDVERVNSQTEQTPMTIPPAAAIALRDLSATWHQRIAVCQRISAAQAADGEIRLAQAWDEEAAIVQRCADDIDALVAASSRSRHE